MKFFSNIYLFQKNILSILVILVISGTSVADETDQSSCDSYNPLKQAYFVDLHIHTGLSADAMLFGTTNRPDDAYAFAQGKSISIQKLTDSIVEAIKKVTKTEPELSTSGGTSDARFISKICPVIEFGIVGKTMHQINENINIIENPNKINTKCFIKK